MNHRMLAQFSILFGLFVATAAPAQSGPRPRAAKTTTRSVSAPKAATRPNKTGTVPASNTVATEPPSALATEPPSALATEPPSAPSSGPGDGEAPESATDTDRARQHFAQATKLYKDGDFDAALVQFERAYQLKPNYKVLYNIGQTYFQLREYVEARDSMRRYVRDGAAQIDAERLAVVTKDLADLDRRIASLNIAVNVNGASVLIDGKPVGKTPLTAPIQVNEGERAVSVEAVNRGVLQRRIRIAGGEQQTLTLDFQALPTVAAGPRVNAPPELHSSHLGGGFWATAIGAVVLGGGAGVTGYLALHAQNDNRAQQKQLGIRHSELEDSNRNARTFALSTDLLAGAAIVCASVATVIWVSTPSYSNEVGLSVGPRSAGIAGRF